MNNRTPTEVESIALRAVKIAIVACLLLLVLGSIGIWIMMNQVAATGQMSHKLNELEKRIERVEEIPILQHDEHKDIVK